MTSMSETMALLFSIHYKGNPQDCRANVFCWHHQFKTNPESKQTQNNQEKYIKLQNICYSIFTTEIPHYNKESLLQIFPNSSYLMPRDVILCVCVFIMSHSVLSESLL